MQLGLWAFSELGSGRELERGSKGALGCDCQEPGPARNPSGDRGRSRCGRDRRRLMSREQAQELHGLSAKPAANLDTDNDEAAPPRSGEFWVGHRYSCLRGGRCGKPWRQPPGRLAQRRVLAAGPGRAGPQRWHRQRGDHQKGRAARDSCTCAARAGGEAASGAAGEHETGGCDIKGTGGERPSLGQQQRSRSRCKVRKVHLVRALVASMGSESLPALERPTVAGYCGVVGTGCGARRPLRGVKTTVTQVLPARGSQQRAEEALCSGGRAGLDDREGVAPRRPVSCVAVGAGTAQAQPTEPLGELGCPDSAGGEGAFELEQVGGTARWPSHGLLRRQLSSAGAVCAAGS